MDEKKKRTLKFLHQFPEDYEIFPANGAWGGVSARGDLLMHFFLEHSAVPDSEVKTINEDGTINDVKKEKKEIEIVRRMQFGVMLTTEQASSLANWILDKVQQYENSKEKVKDEKDVS
ncbi:MAG: hypothetical protein QCH99_03590 [Candidatus Bathyarchaeota archaeon]|nr:hypothetical protein [Candidatus Bathyarchaeum tardum]WGM88548.1 MAG: hypothetical protein NUK63_06385 [Candidatus Bathyarchaeum tardum]